MVVNWKATESTNRCHETRFISNFEVECFLASLGGISSSPVHQQECLLKGHTLDLKQELSGLISREFGLCLFNTDMKEAFAVIFKTLCDPT